MALTLLHGDNQVASRTKLVTLISAAAAAGQEIIRVEAKRMAPADLETALGAQQLFGTPRLVVIEGIHSLPQSKKRTEICKTIAGSDAEIIMWENRALTATMLKLFPHARVELFKTSNAVFSWLDSLTGQAPPPQKKRMLQLLADAVAAESDFLCFTMLIRQVRLLIQAKDGGILKGAPFMIAKLKKQASSFSLEQLLKIHQRLHELDLALKNSGRALSLKQELDLLILTF